MTRRRVVLLVVAAVLVLGGAATAGLWQVTATPQFCNSCHIMRPYVEAWAASKHRQVTCVQCHYPPDFKAALWVKFQAATQLVKWATETYSSKPFAEVQDASCLRSGCHGRSELEARGTITTAGGVRFDHGRHLAPVKTGHQLRCTSCHAQMVVDRHFQVTHATCFTCHFKGTREGRELTPIAGCTGCHEPPQGDIQVGSVRFNHAEVVRRGVACQSCHLNVVEGRGEAPRERCVGCHNQPEKLQSHGDPKRVHAVHVTEHSIECTRCHDEIRHRLPPLIGAPGPGQAAIPALATTPALARAR